MLSEFLAALEAKAKSPMIGTWVDLMIWLDAHEGDDEELEVELSPTLQKLVESVRVGASFALR